MSKLQGKERQLLAGRKERGARGNFCGVHNLSGSGSRKSRGNVQLRDWGSARSEDISFPRPSVIKSICREFVTP